MPVGLVMFERGNDAVGILLPSGKRRLIYRNPRWEKNAEGRSCMTYDGLDQYTKRWGAVKTYGGKLAENVTQAVARDIMAYAMLALDAKGLDLRLTVHDEIIAVVLDWEATPMLNVMLDVMNHPPAWALDLPIAATGWTGRRYKK
jgi:DNA polymerase